NAGSRKKGGTDRPARAPAASKSRKRRQPWLSMAVSASQVMEAAKANQWTWGQGGRALPGRQGNGFGGGLAIGSALGIQRNAGKRGPGHRLASSLQVEGMTGLAKTITPPSL